MYGSLSKTNTLPRILGSEEWPNWNISFKNNIMGFDQPFKILVQDEYAYVWSAGAQNQFTTNAGSCK